jgi:hypothetical protein
LHLSFLKGTWEKYKECEKVMVAGKTLNVSQM